MHAQFTSASNDTKIVKNNEQKLNGKVISKSEDDGFLWPQPEAISSERVNDGDFLQVCNEINTSLWECWL